jgi:hypothetical protein
MKDAEFDQLVVRAGDPRLIAGIYNYCDRRCERCRFTARCFQFQNRLALGEARASDSTESIVGVVARSLERTFDMLRIAARRMGVDLSALEPDPEEAAREDRLQNDPLLQLTQHYALVASRIVQGLRPVVAAREDEGVLAALETIDYFSLTISSKTYRAMIGVHDESYDPADRQSDPNGSAKVARLFIAESTRAWAVLMEAGRATADGVPARLVAMLETIDRGIAERFPDAMAFVRPGFDTDPQPDRP